QPSMSAVTVSVSGIADAWTISLFQSCLKATVASLEASVRRSIYCASRPRRPTWSAGAIAAALRPLADDRSRGERPHEGELLHILVALDGPMSPHTKTV